MFTNSFPEAFCLTDRTKNRLKRAAQGVDYPSLPQYEAFLSGVRAMMHVFLPKPLLRSLSTLKNGKSPFGALLIRNLPLDENLPPTPPDGRRSRDKSTHISEALICGIAGLMGEPYAYEVEKGGELVHDVTPTLRGMSKTTNEGSREALGLHTELAYFEQRPSFLILECLRSDHEKLASTPMVDIRDALPLIPEYALAQLRKPEYLFRVPYIFDSAIPEGQKFSEASAILSGSPDQPRVRAAFYADITTPLNNEAEEALEMLKAACENKVFKPVLEPGDLMILSNEIILHGRDSFTPRFDGKDRWVQRVNVAKSLEPFRKHQKKSLRILSLP